MLMQEQRMMRKMAQEKGGCEPNGETGADCCCACGTWPTGDIGDMGLPPVLKPATGEEAVPSAMAGS